MNEIKTIQLNNLKKKEKHESLTQQYSTWGDKLLQHTDVLYSIQKIKNLNLLLYNYPLVRPVQAVVHSAV